MSDARNDSVKFSRLAAILKFALLIGIIVALNFSGNWLTRQINFQLFPRHDSIINFMILGAILLYVFLMAIPFMPGIEIGLALMMLLGYKGAILVYLCTITALSISFMVGRIIPANMVDRFLKWLHLYKASTLVRQLESLNQPQRLKFLSEKAPAWIAPFLSHYRYLTIAAVLNLPGNSLIGGGGGIGLIVGMSKIIPFHAFILLLAIAVAPIPLWFYFYAG